MGHFWQTNPTPNPELCPQEVLEYQLRREQEQFLEHEATPWGKRKARGLWLRDLEGLVYWV